jgi:hypothetical protein
MPETKARPDSPAQRVPRPTYRHWFALAAAAAVFALMPLGFLPPTYAVPVIGLVLAFGAALITFPVRGRSVADGAIGCSRR